jgi:hypothetical protein
MKRTVLAKPATRTTPRWASYSAVAVVRQAKEAGNLNLVRKTIASMDARELRMLKAQLPELAVFIN